MAQINVVDGMSEIAGNLTKYDKSIEALDLPNFQGTQSIFNPYVVFSLYDKGEGVNGKYDYTLHYDMLPNGAANSQKSNLVPGTGTQLNFTGITSGNFQLQPQSYDKLNTRSTGYKTFASQGNAAPQNTALKLAPTAENIIQYNRNINKVFGYGPTPYSWADFLYCKYYGKIPNTHMVTLRRYPYPISDNVVVPNSYAVVPVAQAVTWFGEETGNRLSDILKMTYGVMWKEVQAIVQEVDGNEQAFGAGFEALAGNKAVSTFGAVLTASRGSYDLWSGREEKQLQWSKKAYTNDGPYWNQIYGPVNVVDKSHMRDRGLKFQSDITLNFHYVLGSYGGVNPKTAMLDLITNFLTLTYTNAKFWGGATRYFPNASFRVGFLGDQRKFYCGDYKGYADTVGSQIHSTLSGLEAGLSKLLSGDFSSLIKQIANLSIGNLSEKSRPNMLSIRSMLSGEPVGEWHVTVGNPLNPIAVIGNLILEETVMELGDAIGADDFPTEVKFTLKLKPGKPRDKGDIESMFNNGFGRMSYAPLTALPSMKNTFGNAKGNPSDKDQSAAELQKLYDDVINKGDYSSYSAFSDRLTADSAVKLVKDRVEKQWGKTFSDSANLLFMINATKSRF